MTRAGTGVEDARPNLNVMSEIPARHRVLLLSVLDDLVTGARPDLLT